VALLIAGAPAALRADDGQRLSVIEENDSLFFDSDKHYTQGLRIGYLGPDLARESAWNEPFDILGSVLPVFQAGEGKRPRRYALSFGQSFFTPSVIAADPPDPRDRPYAGWLYLGASLLQDTDRRMLEHLELQLGVVGPAALGKQVQRQWHEFVDGAEPLGWDSQLENEPGVVLSYERKWRLKLIGDGASGIDLIPELGGSLGNVFTYGEAGVLLRFGRNLQADYGPARIRPALSGTDYFNRDYMDGDFGIYGFVGAQGRAVARNIFLDGNTFRSSPSVDKEPLVADLQAGVSVFWRNGARLDAAVMYRTDEFEGQDSGDAIGIVSFGATW
jgi:lipid A 3-O-deacylase